MVALTLTNHGQRHRWGRSPFRNDRLRRSAAAVSIQRSHAPPKSARSRAQIASVLCPSRDLRALNQQIETKRRRSRDQAHRDAIPANFPGAGRRHSRQGNTCGGEKVEPDCPRSSLLRLPRREDGQARRRPLAGSQRSATRGSGSLLVAAFRTACRRKRTLAQARCRAIQSCSMDGGRLNVATGTRVNGGSRGFGGPR